MGYGDFQGEMSVEQLAVELDWFCGCGNPEDAAESLMEFLDLFPLYENQDGFRIWMPTGWGQRYLFLYLIDAQTEWMEHGGSIGGSWLTDRGKATHQALRREHERDGFESLFDMRCVHGYLTTDLEHDCSAAHTDTSRDGGE